MTMTEQALLTKRDLAKVFQVSETSIGNWLTRGCPHRKKPGSDIGDGYGFDLEEVVEWRKAQEAAGRPQGGRPLESLPRAAWFRPDYENLLRLLSEEAVRSFLWVWFHHEEGLQFVLGVLREAHGGDKLKAAEDLGYIVFSFFSAFGDWLTKGRLDAYLRATSGEDVSLDSLWRAWTGRHVTTTPPTDPEEAKLNIPDWLAKPAAEFVRDHWPTPET